MYRASTLAVAVVASAAAWRAARQTRKWRKTTRVHATAAPSGSLGKYVTVPSQFPDERPQPGDLVRIHYVGTLEDGSVFDSSRARNKPFEFNLGESQVIDGWDMLIGTMALGERAELSIPPEYAYGDAGMPPVVPPNATLTFDVEILDIGRPIDEDDSEDGGEEAVALPLEGDPRDDGSKPFWEEDLERESGRGPGYTWQATGTGAEICISVPLQEDTKVKEIRVDVRTHSMTCKIGDKLVLDGEIFAAVDSDDSHWDLERQGKHVSLLIYLAKLDRHLLWKSLLKGGDPKVAQAMDVEVVDVDAALRMANEQSRRQTAAQPK